MGGMLRRSVTHGKIEGLRKYFYQVYVPLCIGAFLWKHRQEGLGNLHVAHKVPYLNFLGWEFTCVCVHNNPKISAQYRVKFRIGEPG